MSDGLFHFAGNKTNTLTKDGKTYTLTVRRLADYGLKEQAMLLRMASPYQGVEAITDPQQFALAIRQIADVTSRPLIATRDDEARFDDSMRGIAYTLWRSLSVQHPDEFPPGAQVEAGIQLGLNFIAWYGGYGQPLDEIIDAINTAQERDELKNSDGQRATAAA